MKKSIIILTTIILLAMYSCQTAVDSYYYQGGKDVFYFNTFNELDDTFWTGNDGMQKAYIKNGEYYFESLDEYETYNAPSFEINPATDFEVEVAITGPKNAPDEYFGMVLGQFKHDSTFLDLKVNSTGKFLIETNFPLATGEYELLDRSGFKKLTIRKLKGELYFFINEQLKYSYPADAFMNVRAGPVVIGQSAVWLDYMRVSTLK